MNIYWNTYLLTCWITGVRGPTLFLPCLSHITHSTWFYLGVVLRTHSLLHVHLLKMNIYWNTYLLTNLLNYWCSWSNSISSLPISYYPFHLVLFGSSPVISPWLFGFYFPAHLPRLNCLKKKMSQKEIASSRFPFYSQATSSRGCGDLKPLKGTMLSRKRRIRLIIFLFLTISLCPPWCSVLFSSPRLLSILHFQLHLKLTTMSLLVSFWLWACWYLLWLWACWCLLTMNLLVSFWLWACW